MYSRRVDSRALFCAVSLLVPWQRSMCRSPLGARAGRLLAMHDYLEMPRVQNQNAAAYEAPAVVHVTVVPDSAPGPPRRPAAAR